MELCEHLQRWGWKRSWGPEGEGRDKSGVPLFVYWDTAVHQNGKSLWSGRSVQAEVYIHPLGSSQQQTCSSVLHNHTLGVAATSVLTPERKWLLVGVSMQGVWAPTVVCEDPVNTVKRLWQVTQVTYYWTYITTHLRCNPVLFRASHFAYSQPFRSAWIFCSSWSYLLLQGRHLRYPGTSHASSFGNPVKL